MTEEGMVLMRSAKRFHSAIGRAVSAASVHFLPKKGDQSTVNLVLKLVSTGSEVFLPVSSAAR